MSCIISMKEKKMNNLNEDIINNYLTGQCSEEEIIQLNQWIKESDENARQLFRMEEAFHAGRFSCYENEERMARAEKGSTKRWRQSKTNRKEFFACIIG